MHLKNWSLLYSDGRTPALSPGLRFCIHVALHSRRYSCPLPRWKQKPRCNHPRSGPALYRDRSAATEAGMGCRHGNGRANCECLEITAATGTTAFRYSHADRRANPKGDYRDESFVSAECWSRTLRQAATSCSSSCPIRDGKRSRHTYSYGVRPAGRPGVCNATGCV